MEKTEKLEKLKKLFGISGENIFLRLFSTLCITSIIFLVPAQINFTDMSGYSGVSLRAVIGMFALTFIIVTLAEIPFRKKNETVDSVCLLGAFSLYAVFTTVIAENYYYTFGIIMVAAVLVWYYTKKGYFTYKEITKKQLFLLAGILVGVFAVILAVYGIVRYCSNKTTNYDFGIFCQMFYNLKKHLQPLTTTERDELLSHFSVHMSLIYYVILPIYTVFPSPVTLELIQVFALASAGVPVYFLCRKYELSNIKTVTIIAIVMLHPALFGGATYDFHENCFLVPLLLWLFYFFEKKKYIPLAVMAVLICIVKEDAPVYIMFFALWILFSYKEKKDRLTAVFLFGGSLVYFVCVLAWMSKYGDGIMSGRYGNFLCSEDDSLFSAIKNVLANPAYVFTQIFVDHDGETYQDKILFIFQMFVPFAFIPFCVKKVQNIILLFPTMLINLMSLYTYQYDIGFQYVYGPFMFVIYLTIINVSQAKDDNRVNAALRIGAAASAMLLLTSYIPKEVSAVSYAIGSAENNRLVNEYLDSIPEDATVCASTCLIPRLSSREVLYEDYYHKPQEGEKLDYIISDCRFDKTKFIQQYLDLGYEITFTLKNEAGEKLLIVLTPPEDNAD